MQSRRSLVVLSYAAAASAALLLVAPMARAVPAYSGGTYSQNFDTLVNSPTNTRLTDSSIWADDATLPGWFYMTPTNTGTDGYQRLRAGSGNSTTGSLYSFGVNGSTERALGFLNSNSFSSEGETGMYLALRLQNTSSTTYTSFTLTYNGEQWHQENDNPQQIDFSYKLDAAGLMDGGYSAVPQLSFVSPVTGSSASVDGNGVGRTSGITATITGINWEPGQDLWLRWTDLNDVGRDHGLAIDDLSFTASGSGVSGGSRTWEADADGVWSAGSNWLGAAPGGGGTLARLGSGITADRTVTLDTSPTVSGLMISAGAHYYTLNATGGNVLNVAAGGVVTASNGAFGTVGSNTNQPVGTHTISAPLNFATTAEFNVGDVGTLTVGPVSAGAGAGLHKTGTGTLVLTAPGNYSGPTVIDGGLVSFSNTNQLGDDSPTNGLVIHNGGGIMPTADINMTRPLSFDTGGFTVSSDSNATLGPVAGPGMFNKVLSGTVTVASLHTGGAYIAAADRSATANAGVLKLAPNGTDAATSVINFLRIESTTASSGALLGQLDISDNTLLIDYTLTDTQKSPLGGKIEAGAPFPSMDGRSFSRVGVALWSAYAGGHWTGKGITSGRAQTASDAPVSVYSIGYAEASRLLGLTGSETATFAGQTVDATTIIVRSTFGGDANLDGTINGDDYAIVDRQFLRDASAAPFDNTADNVAQHSQWQDGDFNYDGIVNDADYLIIDTGFAFLHPAALTPAFLADREARFGDTYVNSLLASVPEPGSVSLLAIGAASILGRRRRRCC